MRHTSRLVFSQYLLRLWGPLSLDTSSTTMRSLYGKSNLPVAECRSMRPTPALPTLSLRDITIASSPTSSSVSPYSR